MISSEILHIENSEDYMLPIKVQTEITTYLHHAFPLCILLADNKLIPWLYENYLQIFIIMHYRNHYLLNYFDNFDFYRDVMEISDISYKFINMDIKASDLIIDYLNSGYYILAFSDEYYLPHRSTYNDTHFVHENLIYGYNNTRKKLFALGFDENRTFIETEFDYDQFNQSFLSGKIHYKDSAPWAENMAIRLFRPKKFEYPYPFNIQRFINKLSDYLFSKNDSSKEYFLYRHSLVTPIKFEKFGLEIFSAINKGKRYIINGERTIDFRFFHCLHEHKRGIFERLNYIKTTYNVSQTLSNLIKEYESISNRFSIIRNKYVKFEVISKSQNDNPSSRYYLMEIIDDIESAGKEEGILLKKIYEQLKLEFSN